MVVEREYGCGCGVLEVYERPDAAAVGDDRPLAGTDCLNERIGGIAVEAAVAECDPARAGDGLVEIGHRRHRFAHRCRRGWVGRGGLALLLAPPPGVPGGRGGSGDA